MGWNPRLCRSCGNRFDPTRLEDRLCRPCTARAGDLPIVVEYLRTHLDDSLTRVACATGVAEDVICRYAREGLLPHVPSGAEGEPTCSCPPGRSGVCPTCRAELAARIVSGGHAAPVRPPRPVRGMRTRQH
jgi:hypothetical protein